MSNVIYLTEAMEENGKLVIQLPVLALQELGWCEHQILEWMIEEEEEE